MTLSPGFRRAMAWTLVSGVLSLVASYWAKSSSSEPTVAVAASMDSVSMAEKQLAKLRDIAATVPQRREAMKQADADRALREKGLLLADTAQQAQAQIFQILRKLGRDENPPVELRSQDFGPVRPFGDSYGEVFVTVQIDCGVEQLINILVALAARPELLGSNDLRIVSLNPKEKTISVRLTVSGVVPRKLVPGKKGAGTS